MNFLALYLNECDLKENIAISSRVSFLKRIHNIELGKIYNAVIINKGTARVEVLEINDNKIKFKINNFSNYQDGLSINLIIGATRPQMVKRIYKIAVAFGVRSIIFVNSENSEKSYLSSKYLIDNIEKEKIFIEAIEQAGLPIIPEVKVFNKFSLLKDYINTFSSDHFMHIASIDGKSFENNNSFEFKKNLAVHNLIIGPEKGWSVDENLFLDSVSAQFYKLSDGVLRVDQAVNCLLAVLYSSTKL